MAFKCLLFPFSCLQSFYVNSSSTFLIILSTFPLLDGWGFQTYNLKCPGRIYIKTIKPRKWKPQNIYIFFQSLLSSLVNIYEGIQFSILTSFSLLSKCGRVGESLLKRMFWVGGAIYVYLINDSKILLFSISVCQEEHTMTKKKKKINQEAGVNAKLRRAFSFYLRKL